MSRLYTSHARWSGSGHRAARGLRVRPKTHQWTGGIFAGSGGRGSALVGGWLLCTTHRCALCESLTPAISPASSRQSIDISLLQPGEDQSVQPAEDMAPSLAKVRQNDTTGNYYIADVTGLRLTLHWRLDGLGYNVASSEWLPELWSVYVSS